MTQINSICLIGFGEVGQILAADLANRGEHRLSTWDTRFCDPQSAPSRALASRRARPGRNAMEAVAGADLVISAVTAEQTVSAAASATETLKTGAYYLDLNSASPEQKREANRLIEAAGGRYVEAAVMTSVPPRRIATPMLIGGPHADGFLLVARALGFADMQVFSPEVGAASAAKMCRSIVVKGIESLLAESLLTARHYGVEDTVLHSLNDLFPSADWRRLARYMISRSLAHGARRAEEMREVARTVREAGIEPLMSGACAGRQQWAAQHRAALGHDTLEAMLDAVLQSVRNAKDTAE